MHQAWSRDGEYTGDLAVIFYRYHLYGTFPEIPEAVLKRWWWRRLIFIDFDEETHTTQHKLHVPEPLVLQREILRRLSAFSIMKDILYNLVTRKTDNKKPTVSDICFKFGTVTIVDLSFKND